MSACEQKIDRTDPGFLSDVFALTKPKITLMALLVACAGLLQAKQGPIFFEALLSLVGIGALVSGSSALNMFLEKDQDKKMVRTMDRPLPSGRLDAIWAVFVGLFCSVLACFLLYKTSNFLTLFLGLVSLIMYVFCYTPLKQKTWFSLIIGSVPGAMPVMLGYTAVADRIDSRALALFFWAFLWQIPHFLAISLFREQEYTKAGFPVLSARFGEQFAKYALLISSWLLVFSTIGLHLSGAVSFVSLVVSLMLGAIFLIVCHKDAFGGNTHGWAKRAFIASLNYQGLLFLIIIISALF